MPRAVVVGARRRRQGIGEFIAASLVEASVEVAAIVGTSEETVREAQDALEARHGTRPRGYTSLETALRLERPELVAICSPHDAHRAQLEQVAGAGAHCLCEKPLWRPNEGERVAQPTQALADAFASRGLLLDTLTQWPHTLDAFDALHGGASRHPLRFFDMLLSPMSRGCAMIPDCLPHVVSVLHALAGPGEVREVRACWASPAEEELSLRFLYRHSAGDAAVDCRFVTAAARPRPAAYAINGRWIRRAIRLPDYAIAFESEGRSVPLEDPMKQLVRDFVRRVRDGGRTDAARLLSGMLALESVADAMRRGAGVSR